MSNDLAAQLRAQIAQNGFALSRTAGASMRPLIWGGEHCVAVAPLEGEPAVGDLLMFAQRRDGREISVVHRLVAIEPPFYIARGDNRIACEKVSREEIIGRVVEVHRLSGYRPWHIIPRRKFAVADRSFRIYSAVWTAIWPLRRIAYILRGKFSRIFKK